jgi:hypothetical protein
VGPDEAGTSVREGGSDARKPFEAGPEPEAGPATCPTTDPIDATAAPWKPPQALPGSCTEKEIADLVAYVDANTSTSYPNLKKQITDATCAACLFVKDGAKWGVFVEDNTGAFVRNNFGGCVAITSGKEACGKAFSQFDDCLALACQDCAQDAATINKCNTAAGKGACKDSAAVVLKECVDATPVTACDDLAKTYTFEAAARALCVGTGDAGDGG